MVLPRKRLLVDIFFTRRLPKSLAFCEFASVNFEPWPIKMGHLHDGVTLLLRPKSFLFFLSYLNLVIQARLNYKSPILHKKEKL